MCIDASYVNFGFKKFWEEGVHVENCQLFNSCRNDGPRRFHWSVDKAVSPTTYIIDYYELVSNVSYFTCWLLVQQLIKNVITTHPKTLFGLHILWGFSAPEEKCNFNSLIRKYDIWNYIKQKNSWLSDSYYIFHTSQYE